MEEQNLSNLCKKGDAQARKILYEVYAGYLLGVCTRYVGDRAVAQDLLHDAFLKIFASFDKFTWRGNGSLKAWMSRILVNTAIEYLRRMKTDLLTGGNLPDDLPQTYDQPESDLVSKVPEAVILGFISELPTGYRTVFNLFVLEDKSHKEIAALLGINEKSSSSQLLRAKSTLSKRINEYIKENEL